MSASAFKSISNIFNALQTVIAVALAAVSIWFFKELKDFTDLRNRDTHVIDFTIYWPQVLPLIFAIVSIIVILVNGCGFYSSCSKRKSPLYVFVTFLSIVTLVAFAAGIIGLTCAMSKESEEFISSTVNDAHAEISTRKDKAVAFGNIERRLRCCGVHDYVDYQRMPIPESCCDEDVLLDCKVTVVRRIGCAKVAVTYTNLFIKYSSIGALIMAFVGAGSIIAVVLSIRSSRSKSDKFISQAEEEPLKLPL